MSLPRRRSLNAPGRIPSLRGIPLDRASSLLRRLSVSAEDVVGLGFSQASELDVVRTVDAGSLPAPANLTVARCLEDWLTRFLPGTVSPRTEVI
jgi:hypothetical protein